jgi:hypothetical protein
MKTPMRDDSDTDTLDYLLGVVTANREQRCAEILDAAHSQSNEVVKQAHSQVQARMHHHILELREKYRQRVTAAYARFNTLIRQQNQVADRALLDSALPLLQQSLMSLWQDPQLRQQWLDGAIEKASFALLNDDWRIETPTGLSGQELEHLKHQAVSVHSKTAAVIVNDKIKAGVRIIAAGTVVDATLDGLLQQRTVIEAMLISRIKYDNTRGNSGDV